MAKAKNTDTASRRRVAGIALAASLIALALPSSAAAADCPNEAIREAQTSEALPLGTTQLPGCMALELLSPPKKFGQEATGLSAFSPDGTRALYKSKAALADTEGLQSFAGDSYIGSLGSGGWTTSSTSPPKEANIQVGTGSYGGPYAFSQDLAAWVTLSATQAQQYPAEAQFFTDGLEVPFTPLSPLLAPINDSGESIMTVIANTAPSGTAADLSATVFPIAIGYESTVHFPGDPRPAKNSYLAYRDEDGDPSLALLNREKDGIAHGGRCGSALGGANGNLNQGAISNDGSRIYLSARPAQPWDEENVEGPPCSTANPLRVMVREETLGGPEIAELFTSAVPGGDDLYQGASLDGSKVFLATPRKLTASDQDTSAEACGSDVGSSKGCDLYLYDEELPPSERLIQVSKGGSGDPDPGKDANVLASTISLSPDGSHAYFVAQGALTDVPNPEGASAQANKPNLYLYESSSGETSFIATLAEEDKEKLWGLARSFANRAYAVPLIGGAKGGDGHILFFASKAQLLPEDSDAALSDVYRYDADEDTLICPSCDPALPEDDIVAGPNEGLDVPPSSDFATQGRWASEDGETIVFATAPPAPADGDPYIWKEGQVSEMPSDVIEAQRNPLGRPVLSSSGEIAGFTSTDPLLPQDGDSARDVYLLRVGGGFPNPTPKPICDPLSEGSCQGAPSGVGVTPGIATATFSGPGDQKAKPKPRCRKGKVRRRGRCVKRQGKGKERRQRAAGTKQGGSK